MLELALKTEEVRREEGREWHPGEREQHVLEAGENVMHSGDWWGTIICDRRQCGM